MSVREIDAFSESASVLKYVMSLQREFNNQQISWGPPGRKLISVHFPELNDIVVHRAGGD